MEKAKPGDVIDFYDKYVERQKHHGVNERHLGILKKAIKHGLKPHSDALEIGCGIGTQTELLIKHLKKGSL